MSVFRVAMLSALLATSASASGSPSLWLEPVRLHNDTRIWFADELEPIADAVASLLAKPKYGGHRIIPPREVRTLWQNVRAGRLPGVANVCEAAPPPALLTSVVYPEARSAELTIDCEAAHCALTVVVRQAGPRPPELARYALSLPKTATPLAWAATIRRQGLKRIPTPNGGGGGIRGGEQAPSDIPGIYATLFDVQQSGPWTYELDRLRFQRHAESLDACGRNVPRWRDWWSQPQRIEVDATGHATRCEAPHPDHLPPPAFACICEVIKQVDFGAGAAGRRASFLLGTVRVEAPAPPKPRSPVWRSAYLGETRADDASAILGTGHLDSTELLTCIEPITQPTVTKIPIQFLVGADGSATATDITWPSANLPELTRECLATVLRNAQFDCPLSGHARIDASLFLRVEAPR